jgi:[3-methyl-2-oxobutanoate dehydrogenase (acetyl-transferring)] kinase
MFASWDCIQRENWKKLAFFLFLNMCFPTLYFVAEHHMALHDPQPGYIGIINTKLSPAKLARCVFDRISEISLFHYGTCPTLEIEGMTEASLVYIPVHLEYVLAELFKNSIRATVERFDKKSGLLDFPDSDDSLPPISLTISGTKEDMELRIRDQGGGIPYDRLPRVFEYSFTTVKGANADQVLNTFSGADQSNLLGFASEISMQQCTGGPLAGLVR